MSDDTAKGTTRKRTTARATAKTTAAGGSRTRKRTAPARPADENTASAQAVGAAAEAEPQGAEGEEVATRPFWDRKAYASIETAARKVLEQVRDAATTLAQDAVELVHGRAWQPNLDLYQEGNELVIVVEVPGAPPDGFDVAATPNLVTVHGSVPAGPAPSDSVVYHERRRRTGEFYREVALPVAIVSDQLTARLKRGVLELRAPVAPAVKVKPVRVDVRPDGSETERPASSG